MVWYKPWTWGQTEPVPQAAAVMEPPVVGTPAPAMGGRRRKTHRRHGRKSSRRGRSGRKSTH